MRETEREKEIKERGKTSLVPRLPRFFNIEQSREPGDEARAKQGWRKIRCTVSNYYSQ